MIINKTTLKYFEGKGNIPQRNYSHTFGTSTKMTNRLVQFHKMKDDTAHNKNIQEWLEKLEDQFITNISKMNFTVDDLAIYMGISKRKLYRLTHKYLGVTPHHYLKNYRLNYARQLLMTKRVDSVKAAAYSTGFPNTIYFSRQFKEEFDYLPSSLLDKL